VRGKTSQNLRGSKWQSIRKQSLLAQTKNLIHCIQGSGFNGLVLAGMVLAVNGMGKLGQGLTR
jgi:hypothetical protein